jgi:hypothetical protein
MLNHRSKRGNFCLCIIFLFSLWGIEEACSQQDCVSKISEDDLAGKVPGPEQVIQDAGDGVKLLLIPGITEKKLAGPRSAWMKISVTDRGRPIQELADSFYLGYAMLARGPVRFWMIGEYTGGAHCCARYHFFARSLPDEPLRYLGATRGSADGLDEEPFVCRNDKIHLKDMDIRFLYFHTPYAQSILAIPTYYRLNDASLVIDNRPFRKEFLQAVEEVEGEITDRLNKRNNRPAFILSDDDSEFFSDELGQLLIKRTILYLYAREDQKAWKTLDRDVRKHYKSSKGLHRIKSEIRKTLNEDPY